MAPSDLTWQITWRSTLHILALGGLFGGIYGPSMTIVMLFIAADLGSILQAPMVLIYGSLVFMFFGACIGLFIGGCVGALIGLVISAMTIGAFRPLRDAAHYVRVVQWASVLLGSIGTLVGIPLLVHGLMREGAYDEVGTRIAFSFVPALLAGLAIRRSSWQVAMWYVRTTIASTSAE
jgi:hypothetical protein